MKNVYLIIMAGGVGSRFWPLSRTARPKQFLDILGVGKSFLRQTYERFLPLVPPENILVVTDERYRPLVREQIPELADDRILGEPLGRNTAPCIAYAAFRLRATAPDSVMIVSPADQFITGEAEFQRAITDSVDFARAHDAILTVGITPSRPDTGYGYIQAPGGGAIEKVKTFTEKPSLEVARSMVESGEFLWNSGLFVWRTSTILSALESHVGDIFELFDSSREHFGTPSEAGVVQRIYPETRSVSIDFGVIERADNVYVRRSDFGWSDLGTWNAMYLNLPRDEQGNSAPANACLHDTTGTLIEAPEGKLVVARGLKDYIVVDTPDVLLVWPRAAEQDIKQVVDDLRFAGSDATL